MTTVALAGNPNCGKTSLFNALTGAHHHVGNWPGVTVERRSGGLRVPLPDGRTADVEAVDLPGTYSLSARTEDERIAATYLAEPDVDLIVNVLDASNLERNLYLTTQLLELKKPLVFALNMADDARRQGVEFDLEAMGVLLGGPVIGTVGNRGEGIEELKAAIGRTLQGLAPEAEPEFLPVKVGYGHDIESEIAGLEAEIARDERLAEAVPTRALAVRLLEGAPDALAQVEASHARKAIQARLTAGTAHLEAHLGADAETLLTEQRYGFAKGLVHEVQKARGKGSAPASSRLDRVLTHRIWGIPAFLAVMVAVYTLTFVVGKIPQDWIGDAFAWLQGFASTHLPAGELTSLLADGII
ncbi:MAG TPA: ferrous iron transporter B, partial [Holophaga sp.]|nr:ferrous iron transporter B [Holophaga sp.]